MKDILMLQALWNNCDDLKDLAEEYLWDYEFIKDNMPFKVLVCHEIHRLYKNTGIVPRIKDLTKKQVSLFKSAKYLMWYAGFRSNIGGINVSSTRYLNITDPVRRLDIFRYLDRPIISLPEKASFVVPVPNTKFTAHHFDKATLEYVVLTNDADPLKELKYEAADMYSPLLTIRVIKHETIV